MAIKRALCRRRRHFVKNEKRIALVIFSPILLEAHPATFLCEFVQLIHCIFIEDEFSILCCVDD